MAKDNKNVNNTTIKMKSTLGEMKSTLGEMKSTLGEMKSTLGEMKSISLFETPFKPFVVARFKKVLKPYKSL